MRVVNGYEISAEAVYVDAEPAYWYPAIRVAKAGTDFSSLVPYSVDPHSEGQAMAAASAYESSIRSVEYDGNLKLLSGGNE